MAGLPIAYLPEKELKLLLRRNYFGLRCHCQVNCFRRRCWEFGKNEKAQRRTLRPPHTLFTLIGDLTPRDHGKVCGTADVGNGAAVETNGVATSTSPVEDGCAQLLGVVQIAVGGILGITIGGSTGASAGLADVGHH